MNPEQPSTFIDIDQVRELRTAHRSSLPLQNCSQRSQSAIDWITRAWKFELILQRSSISRERSLAEVQALAEVITPQDLPTPVCRDPDDDQILALALAAQADLIISGDKDLLDLKAFQNIPIVSPAEALPAIEAQK